VGFSCNAARRPLKRAALILVASAAGKLPSSTLPVSRWQLQLQMFIVIIYETRICQYASGSDKVGEQFTAIAQRLPRSGCLCVCLACAILSPSQGRNRQQGLAEEGYLVRLSLRAIDQEVSPTCSVASASGFRGAAWARRRDSSAAEARFQPYDSSARLNTTVLYHNIASSLAPAVTRCAMTETDGGN
jgi:hypothetical protein